MFYSMRSYALVGLLLLTVFNYSHGFKFGSRGLSDTDMGERQIVDIDAGNQHEEKKTQPKVLNVLSNKEYLFGNEDFYRENLDSVNNVKQKTLSSDSLDLVDSDESTMNNNDYGHLKREQRTHSSDNHENGFKNFEIDNFLNQLKAIDYENAVADNEYNNEYYDYDLFMNEVNSNMKEDEMNTNEIQGPQPYDLFYDTNLDYNQDELEEFLDRQASSKNHESSNDESPRVQEPVIHYKESFVSGDIYNKKLLDENLNDQYKGVSESMHISSSPEHVKNAKLSHYDPLHQHQTSIVGQQDDYFFISIIAACTISALVAVFAGGACYYKMNKTKNNGFEGKNSLFTNGLSKSNSLKSTTSSSSGDRRLAQSAQMFHYQHQKQQMIAMEKANNDTKQDQSDNSDGEAEEGDYTVYECPGLAPTGEMEVRNPLFKEEYPSTNNLTSATSLTSMPPAYSTVTAEDEKSKGGETKLIEVNETNKPSSSGGSDAKESVKTTTNNIESQEKQ